MTQLLDRLGEYETAKADLIAARERLNAAIRREYKQGKKSLRDLAKETGLTYSRIGQIIREGSE